VGGRAGVDESRKSLSHRFFVFVLFSVLHLYYFFVLIVLAVTFVLTVHHTTQTSLPPVGFESATPARDRPETLALDLSATGIGKGIDPRISQPVTSRYID
jgi:hypothetical protein